MITGESMPVEKARAQRVIGATVNGTGSLVMRAEHVGSETLLAQIVRLVGQAQRSRAPIQRLADAVAAWFVPAVIAVAVLTFLAWAVLGPEPRLAHAHGECGGGADHCLPVRAGAGDADGDHGRHRPRGACRRADQERRGAGDAGKGRHARRRQDRHADRGQAQGHRIQSIVEVLRLAASLERASEHPLASAVVAAASQQSLHLSEVSGFEYVAGKGVKGVVEGKRIAAGNTALMTELGVFGSGRRNAGSGSDGARRDPCLCRDRRPVRRAYRHRRSDQGAARQKQCAS